MELLVILFFIYAVHSAVEDTKSALRKSRDAYASSAAVRFPNASKSRRVASAARHDAGFWTGQAAHGFPAARHGLAAGWHAGRQAQAEGRAAREKAKADHLETRVRLIPEVRAHVARQREALEKLRAEREAQEGAREGSPQSVMAPPQRPPADGAAAGEVAICPGEGSPAVPAPRPGTAAEGNGRAYGYRTTYSYGPAGAPLGWPAGADADMAHLRARTMGTARNPWAVTEHPPGAPGKVIATYPAAGEAPEGEPAAARICVACGNPEYGPRRGGGNWGPLVTYTEPLFPDRPPEPRLVHQAHFEDESTGFYGRPYEDAPAQDGTPGQPQEETEGSGEGTAAPETETPVSPTQGEPAMAVAADTTYDGVLASMTTEKGNAEQRAAEQRQASREASTMSEQMQALEVDPRTLSAMADHLDAHDAATKAQQHVQETAEAVESAMKRGHKGLNEAHQNAPVQAADKAFYAG